MAGGTDSGPAGKATWVHACGTNNHDMLQIHATNDCN